jgi:hypothetical protein
VNSAPSLQLVDYILALYLLLLIPPHLRPNVHYHMLTNLFPLIDQLQDTESLPSAEAGPINNGSALRTLFPANTNRQFDAIMPFYTA